jgi:hypothetical protein
MRSDENGFVGDRDGRVDFDRNRGRSGVFDRNRDRSEVDRNIQFFHGKYIRVMVGTLLVNLD